MVIMGKFDPKTFTGWALLVDNGDLGAPMNSGRLTLAFAVVLVGVAVKLALT